jgi:Ca2+-binding EF-hand superfamily protein
MTSSGLSGQNNAQLASSRNDDEDDIFTSSDSNKDGAISYEEFVASSGVTGDQAKQIFTDIDTNGDGALSEDEVLAFKESMQASTAATSEDELSKLLLELIQSSKASSAEKAESTEDESTVTANSTSTTSSYESEEDEIFSYFDKDGDGFVSDTELDEGIQSLQTAMQNYMISMQENRAAL